MDFEKLRSAFKILESFKEDHEPIGASLSSLVRLFSPHLKGPLNNSRLRIKVEKMDCLTPIVLYAITKSDKERKKFPVKPRFFSLNFY